MNHPTTRVLTILELLQARGRVNSADLAQRLGVDRRTIRRYIAMLEELGIPITTERGPQGGYELVAGFKLPPMMFSNDEALALALGLATVGGLGLAVAGARTKLERVMPEALKERMRAVEESIVFAQTRGPSLADAASLPLLSAAAHRREGVRIQYRSASGDETVRDFDSHGLAFRGGRWYAAGYCHLRKGLRSFRLDRVLTVTPQARRFEKPAKFDVLEHLAMSIATLPRKFTIEVWLETDLEAAQRELFQTIGVLEPCEGGVLMRSQADDMKWYARELARLPWRFEIRRPAGLRKALAAHAGVLSSRVRSGRSR